MNFLAHIYLSGDNELVTIGNFIADGFKGKSYENIERDIKIGILLHRQIDNFTDTHETVKKSTKRLHENYGHYSGVIVDILYDHFLAKNWKIYSNIPLEVYANRFYNLLETHFDILPERIQNLMGYMIADNWLVSYASIEGISNILERMNRRTKSISGMDKAVIELEQYYDEFEAEFTSFFEELRIFSRETLKVLNEKV